MGRTHYRLFFTAFFQGRSFAEQFRSFDGPGRSFDGPGRWFDNCRANRD
jgi:hypothetical protein